MEFSGLEEDSGDAEQKATLLSDRALADADDEVLDLNEVMPTDPAVQDLSPANDPLRAASDEPEAELPVDADADALDSTQKPQGLTPEDISD